jgi:hypothetical protein
MNEKLLAPCGTFCGTCEILERAEKPNCLGCGRQNGHLFWGECKLFSCAVKHGVNHCGECADFLCDLFADQFDPSHGQESAFTRGGLLAYRRKAGTAKYVQMAKKLAEEEKR